MPNSKSIKKLYIGGAIYFFCVYFFICSPPSLAVIDRINPHILGLPCSQFCILFAAFAIAIGLMVMYILEVRIEDREDAQNAEVKNDDK